ncbi:peptidylprolyl isomerase [Streptomyces sp. NPDC051940]|uniref:peptidylprolyl isomerase n=1 Tax=Streptomyces sp. NPDC051940 TaxID=3155675 RepID=UPI0034424A65
MVTKDQRRRQLAREKFERQQNRRVHARQRARQRNIVIAAALAVVLAGGGAVFAAAPWENDGKEAKAGSTPSAAPTSKAPDPCDKPAEGAASTKQWKEAPKTTIDAKAAYTMNVQTTCGDIAVKLDAKGAPKTVNSFNFLAGEGFFDHTKCHRLVQGGIFVLQCGDPTGTGSGGPGYSIPDENLKSETVKGGVYPTGTVAMANAGPNTGGSQFFFVFKDSQLPASYTPFGTVDKEGLAVLQKIADAGIQGGAGDGAPNATVVIDKLTVTKG